MAETHAGLVGESDPVSAVTAKAGPEMSSPGTSESGDYDSNCVFCRIAAGQEPETELFDCENEDLVCFRDIKPAARYHYLVVPKKHIGSCKDLNKDHIEMVESMVAAGKTMLERNNFTDFTDVRRPAMSHQYPLVFQNGLPCASVLLHLSSAPSCDGTS
ncbi:adenosine 5'-monophosphoramidase HINT3 isoform X2 [Arvicanthis niloticus]|uniref:adenosine 5'-monophosphoramidase HINT3 isoform X2 n=1 Tax=Arvicanthis niloticus TaxID=61156 RepID=UPI00402BCE83